MLPILARTEGDIMKLGKIAFYSLVCLSLSAPLAALAEEKINNGGFESGAFDGGWVKVNREGSHGDWYIDGSPPVYRETIGPASGSYFAVTEQGGAGTHLLLQAFQLKPGLSSVVLSFDMFRRNYDGAPASVHPGGLDHNLYPNQHARVDILNAAATDWFSIAPGDVAVNVVAPGVDPGTGPVPYIHYEIDLTSALSSGGAFYLRFGEVDNQQPLTVGVDNVSLLAVPEPEAWQALAAGLLLLFGWRRWSKL